MRDHAATWLYIPAPKADTLLPKAVANADAVIIDFEDATHPSQRAEARVLVTEVLTSVQPIPVDVRVNAVGSDDFALDMAAIEPLVREGLVQGVRLPKVESAADVAVAQAIAGSWSDAPLFVCLLESALGVANAHEIARAVGVQGLSLGESDLRADLALPRDSDDGLLLARQTAVLASRAAGLRSPMGSVFPNVNDEDGLRASCESLRRLGFFGRSCIHPKQIAPVREVFAPQPDEVAWAGQILAKAGDMDVSGSGAAKLDDGSFIDPAIVRLAQNITARALALGVSS